MGRSGDPLAEVSLAGDLVGGDLGVVGEGIVDLEPEVAAGTVVAGNAGCWLGIEMSDVEVDGPIETELSPVVEVRLKMMEMALGCHTEIGYFGYDGVGLFPDTHYNRPLGHGSHASHLVAITPSLDNPGAEDGSRV